MSRSSTAIEEEVSFAEVARRLGMTKQAVGQWADRAGSPTILKAGRRYALWPKFPIWYRQELIANREKPGNIAESEARIAAADAELKELKLQRERGEVVAVESFREAIRKSLGTVRSQLLAIPGRYAARTASKATLIESQTAWDAAVRDILNDLRNGDGAS